MKLYSHKGSTPEPLPERIRLSSGFTRTDSKTFTNEEILDAGYVLITQEKPYPNLFEKVIWTGSSWQVIPMTYQEMQQKKEEQWKTIRLLRNDRIAETEWRISRYESECRQGLTPTDDIVLIDKYIQELRNITLQEDPFNIVWPQQP